MTGKGPRWAPGGFGMTGRRKECEGMRFGVVLIIGINNQHHALSSGPKINLIANYGQLNRLSAGSQSYPRIGSVDINNRTVTDNIRITPIRDSP